MGLFDKALHAAQTSNRPGEGALPAEWKTNRVVTLACEPENLEELKAAVDVADPGSVPHTGYMQLLVLPQIMTSA